MIRPARLMVRICAAALIACSVSGRAQEPREPAGALSAVGALPELPATGLLDGGKIFGPEEAQLLAADLETFRGRVGVPLFVVTVPSIPGGTLEQFGERLVSEGFKGRSGMIVLYDHESGELNYSATPGALGRSEDIKFLFLAGSSAAAALPETATTAQRLRAAVQALTRAAEGWKKLGLLPGPDATVPPATLPAPGEPPPAHAPATEPATVAPDPPPQPAAGRWQRGILASLAAALLLGALLLFGFHRWQERTESRSSARFHLPDVRVGQRLGAARGGGVMAAVSFREKR